MHSHEDRTVAEEMVFLYIRSSIWKKLNNLVDTTIPVCYDNKKHYHSFISEKSFILKERQCLIPKNQKKAERLFENKRKRSSAEWRADEKKRRNTGRFVSRNAGTEKLQRHRIPDVVPGQIRTPGAVQRSKPSTTTRKNWRRRAWKMLSTCR